MNKEKPKVAFYWCASCGGCEESVVDLAEDLLKVAELVDIVFWPVAMDFKKEDVEKLKDKEILASFINGAVRLKEHEEMVKLLRKKSQFVIAYGACAHLGGIPGLANLYTKEKLLEYVYKKAPSVKNEENTLPMPIVKLNDHYFETTEVLENTLALDQVIEVDYYIPGCPPTPDITRNAMLALLSGKLPPKGKVFGSEHSLCSECPLNETKPVEGVTVREYKRLYNTIPEKDKCFLLQGIPCLGPVTRGGCGALCINAHMPCTGCFGPLDKVKDFGAKAISTLASIIAEKEEAEIEEALKELKDPAGIFYRFSLPKSFVDELKRSKGDGKKNND